MHIRLSINPRYESVEGTLGVIYNLRSAPREVGEGIEVECRETSRNSKYFPDLKRNCTFISYELKSFQCM